MDSNLSGATGFPSTVLQGDLPVVSVMNKEGEYLLTTLEYRFPFFTPLIQIFSPIFTTFV